MEDLHYRNSNRFHWERTPGSSPLYYPSYSWWNCRIPAPPPAIFPFRLIPLRRSPCILWFSLSAPRCCPRHRPPPSRWRFRLVSAGTVRETRNRRCCWKCKIQKLFSISSLSRSICFSREAIVEINLTCPDLTQPTYPGIPNTPKARDSGRSPKSGISHASGNPLVKLFPLEIVRVLQPNSPTRYLPIGYLGFLVSITLKLNRSLRKNCKSILQLFYH